MQICNDFVNIDNFWLYQFECPCCQRVIINPGLVEVLEILWEAKGAFVISAGGAFRCGGYHNRIYWDINKDRLGRGLPEIRIPAHSRHLIGQAVDISLVLPKEDDSWLFNVGVRGVGRATHWSHIDIRTENDFDNESVDRSKRLASWTY